MSRFASDFNRALGEQLYKQGRALHYTGQLEDAVAIFEQSVSEFPHYKAFEHLGECLCQLGRFREAMIPLAAATGLNRHYKAPTLLAEALLEINENRSDALRAAELALSLNPDYKRAKQIKQRILDEMRRHGDAAAMLIDEQSSDSTVEPS